MFFRAQYFKDLAYLCREAKNFGKYPNQNHHYSTLGGLTPKPEVFWKYPAFICFF